MKPYYLYAEDDADDIAIFKDAMRREEDQNDTVYVRDGFALLRHLHEVKTNETYPSLILLDFHLPRLNGMDTLILLKTDDLYRLIPVIILSANLSPADEASCMAMGADIIIKPTEYSTWPSIFAQLRTYQDE